MMFLLLSIYLCLFIFSIIIVRRGENILNIFLERNSIINNEIVLNEYKTVVAYSMYLALIYGFTIILNFFICIILIWSVGLIYSIGLFSFLMFTLSVFEQEVIELGKKGGRGSVERTVDNYCFERLKNEFRT